MINIGDWVEITKEGHPWKGAPALIFRITSRREHKERDFWMYETYWGAVIDPAGWVPYILRVRDIDPLTQATDATRLQALEIDRNIPK